MATVSKEVGDTFKYVLDGVTHLATVITTYTDDDNNDIATLSLSGTDKIIRTLNSFEEG